MLGVVVALIHSPAVIAARMVTQRIAIDPRSDLFPPPLRVRVATAM
jgi:hypothetical protein